MPFLARGGTIDVVIPAGQSIALGSYGAGTASVHAQTLIGNQPQTFYPIANLTANTTTLGPYPIGLTARLFASFACELEYTVGASPSLGGTSGGGSKSVTLNGTPYTLSAADDNTYFSCTATTTVTIPAGLSPPPQCVFMPPAAGSITLHPTGGVTLNGSTSDIAINTVTNPVPAGLSKTSITDNYGVTTAGSGYASLTGNPTDSATMVSTLAGYLPLPTGAQKLSVAYTLQASDNETYMWLNAQGVDKIITIPSAILNGSPFRVLIGYLNGTAAAGRCNIKPGGGTTIQTTINQSTGALATLTNGIFMGAAGSNNIAACWVVSQGGTPGGGCAIFPICGTFATS